MRFAIVPMLSASMLALSACGGEATSADADGDGTVSGEEARAMVEAAGADIRPLPGKYRSTIEFISAEIPGAPDQMGDMLGTAMGNSFEFCLTPEEAEKGFEESMTEGRESCSIKSFEIDDNDLDMKMSCGDGTVGTMEVAMTGSVTPTRSDMRMNMNGQIPQVGEASFEMSMVQERIGDCDG